jgi:DNA-binding NtrC family response regulator
VKLLRVIQARTYQRLGTTKDSKFRGKIVAATHRDIHRSMESGEFRRDFYYRLCSDIITTPSLQEQISETPEVLGDLVAYISQRVAGSEGEAVASEALAWIQDKLGSDYPWPGNIRELEQCVRNVMIRREYHPAAGRVGGRENQLQAALREGSLTLEQLCRIYCTHIYSRTGSYVETARRLKIDRRTVKKYVN